MLGPGHISFNSYSERHHSILILEVHVHQIELLCDDNIVADCIYSRSTILNTTKLEKLMFLFITESLENCVSAKKIFLS